MQSIDEYVRMAGDGTLSGLALRLQAEQDGAAESELRVKMAHHLEVMRASAESGMKADLRSLSGLTGGQASKIRSAVGRGATVGGPLLGMAAARAMAIAESNACMGRIVAAPTAGSCGILPAALLTAQEIYDYTDEELIDALFTAALVGQVIADRASVSGAEGGCQAECGSAAAMTAAALTELRGGSASAAAQACSFALMNSMGLVCDPVGGLVEIPCVYRNVGGVACALTAADMALSGLTCPIPTDEVIDAMSEVGHMLPACLRETGEGGVAATDAGKAIAANLQSNQS